MSRLLKMSTEQARRRIYENYGGSIELISQCNNSKEMIWLRCNDCGYEWQAIGSHYLKKNGFTKSPCKQCRFNDTHIETCCACCGKKITKFSREYNLVNRGFCSSSCSAKITNHERKNIRHCLYCGVQLTGTKLKYCSNKCHTNHMTDVRVQNWLNGVNDGMVGQYQLSTVIRRYLINKAGNKCEKCGWSIVNEFTGIVPLQIHHVDGNCKNNNIDNLQVLCPCCHALTPNFKGLNRGNGREQRNKYN